jgi:predicted aspartyl protease
VINLLVDTGSTYTILPVEVLESVGLSPTQSREHERIATGSGYIMAPKVTFERLDILGRQFRRIITIAHTLPFGGIIDGLLGMDLLCQMKAKIFAAKGTIEIWAANCSSSSIVGLEIAPYTHRPCLDDN